LDPSTTELVIAVNGSGSFQPQHLDLERLTRLHTLRLNGLSLVNSQLANINFFGASTALRTLYLDDNNLGDDIGWLCQFTNGSLANSTRIDLVSLRGNPMQQPRFTQACSNIVKFDFERTSLRSLDYLSLKTNFTLLETLDAPWPLTSPRGPPLSLERFQELLFVDLANRNINSLTYCSILPNSNRVRSLNLSNCNIRHIDSRALHRALGMAMYQGNALETALANNPVQCRVHPDYNAGISREVRIECDCVDPPFRNASHCPKLEPLACSGGRQISQTQICDGTVDCKDGEDEDNCDMQWALDGGQACAVSVQTRGGDATFVECMSALNVTIGHGVLTAQPSGPNCAPIAAVATSLTELEGTQAVSALQ
jgi:hypothetical protein